MHNSAHNLKRHYQVHEEVQIDGQVRDEEGCRPSAGVVALHHHIRVTEKMESAMKKCIHNVFGKGPRYFRGVHPTIYP